MSMKLDVNKLHEMKDIAQTELSVLFNIDKTYINITQITLYHLN